MRQVSINREVVRPARTISDGFDLHLVGDCDDVIRYLCGRLGWELPPLPSKPSASARETCGSHAAKRQRAGSGEPPGKQEEDRSGGRSGVEDGGGVGERPLGGDAPSFEPPNRYVFWAGGEGAGEGSAPGVEGGRKEEEGDGGDFEEVVTW